MCSESNARPSNKFEIIPGQEDESDPKLFIDLASQSQLIRSMINSGARPVRALTDTSIFLDSGGAGGEALDAMASRTPILMDS